MFIMRLLSIAAFLTARALFAQLDHPSQYNVPRFFPDNVNNILFDGEPLGDRLVYRGHVIKDRAEIYDIAVDVFLGLAKSRGIPERSISKAMFEGRINPHRDDLTAILYGLRKYMTPDEKQELKRAQALRYNSMLLIDALGKEWDKKFGSILEIERVHTILDGKWRDATGSEIRARVHSKYDLSVYSYFTSNPRAGMITAHFVL